MAVQTLQWIGGTDGVLELIDQRRLPTETVQLLVRDIPNLHEAIRTLAVRGAPAIGVAAAYGPVLALQRFTGNGDLREAVEEVSRACDHLATSRPTAVNLFWALDRMRQRAKQVSLDPQATVDGLRETLLAEAEAIREEDVAMCRRIGEHGERFIRDGFGVLTHCNAGALATAGLGTACAVMFAAHEKGRRFEVYADETRPLLQGARLTAWELREAGIPVTVICDNMAGFLMKRGKVQMVVTGADRIAANGDAANKIGTYGLSVLAKHHGVPFYVAAPSSTFDMSLSSGEAIPIEERAREEVIRFAGVQTAPDDVGAWNPAFDVTEAENITAIITERGVIESPNADRVRALLQ